MPYNQNYREAVTAEMIRLLKEGVAPWQKPWEAGIASSRPFNAATGKPYQGVNSLWLEVAGYTDPRWLTFKQASSMGLRIRKGERSRAIEYWQWEETKPVLDKEGDPVLDEDGKPVQQSIPLDRPRLYRAAVFNAEQVEGLEPYKPREPSFEPVERAEGLLRDTGLTIKHDQSDRAFYNPGSDQIHLPAQAAFTSAYEYYATALHEAGHATGAQHRINREFGPFGSEAYAREELVAELASYQLCRDAGLGHFPDNHASYVQSWIKLLEDSNQALFQAAAEAEKVQRWITEPALRADLERQAFNQTTPSLDRAPAVSPDQQKETDRIYLTVPFADRQIAKELGARWDKQQKSWYAPEGADQALLARWQRRDEEPTKEPVLLEVPFSQKDQVKKLGARWDKDQKSWYVPDGLDRTLFTQWLAQEESIMTDPVKTGPDVQPAVSPQTLSNTPGEPTQSIDNTQPKGKAPRAYLAVPFKDKDEAKGLGAKWDRKAKSWYAPEGTNPDTFTKWQQASQTSSALSGLSVSSALGKGVEDRVDPVIEFEAFLAEHGVSVEVPPILDGRWHRVPLEGETGSKKSASYRGFAEGSGFGQLHDFKSGETHSWTPTHERLSPEQVAALRAEAATRNQALKAARLLAQKEAQEQAVAMWEKAPQQATQENSFYLRKKQVRSHGLKLDDQGGLLVPVRDVDGVLHSVQRINGEGKFFLKGGRKEGLLHWVNNPNDGRLKKEVALTGYALGISARPATHKEGGILPPDNPKQFIIAEGYATAASLHEATGLPVAAAFDSGNLLPVAKALRQKYPKAEILIAGDNDHSLLAKPPHKNVGEEKAAKAARAIGAHYIVPALSDRQKEGGLTDFNDLAVDQGHKALRSVIKQAFKEQRQDQKQGLQKDKEPEQETVSRKDPASLLDQRKPPGIASERGMSL